MSTRRPGSTGSPTLTFDTRLKTPMAIEDQDDDTRLYLGPARNGELLEVVTVIRQDGSELVIHAMSMRSKYRRLLPGG